MTLIKGLCVSNTLPLDVIDSEDYNSYWQERRFACRSIRIVVKIVGFNSTANSILTIRCSSAARSATRTSYEKCSCPLGSYSRVPVFIQPIIALRPVGPARENRGIQRASPRANLKRRIKKPPKKATLIRESFFHIRRKEPWFSFAKGFLIPRAVARVGIPQTPERLLNRNS